MPTWTTEEKTATFNSNDGFSDAAYYNGHASPIYGEFVNEYAEIDMASGSVSSSGPAFRTATTNVASAVKGDTLSQSGVGYSVTTVRHDGYGMTVLLLRKT